MTPLEIRKSIHADRGLDIIYYSRPKAVLITFEKKKTHSCMRAMIFETHSLFHYYFFSTTHENCVSLY